MHLESNKQLSSSARAVYCSNKGTKLTADDRPGTANIEEALESPENERFILHDSQGFESGDDANYAVAKNFIQKRKVDPDVSEQLHAIW